MKSWALITILILTGCASRTTTFGEETPGSEGYRVRLEASCDECLIRWSAGTRGGEVRESALWSESFYIFVHPDLPIAARITATSLPGTEPVAYVRIRVDGEVVAEARGRDGGMRGGGGMPGSLWVEARIPEREARGGPSE